jgi:molybdopterin molybdotransferase
LEVALSNLLSVDEALAHILSTIKTISSEPVHLTQALGRIITEDVQSNINLPTFDNSGMDGYAVKFDDTLSASPSTPIMLTVVMDIPAGTNPTQALTTGQAARIMTGAPVPQGATAVIPVEDTTENWQQDASDTLPQHITITQPITEHANIRLVGNNIAIGDTVITAGTQIHPAEIGMLAALGKTHINVIRQPKVVILTTGDELVDVDQPLAQGKIRDTNSYTLSALVQQAGGIPLRLPIASDHLDSIRKLYQAAIDEQPDIIISSAGVSVGTADLVKRVIREIGNIDFWRINIRPGKPLAFGDVQGIPYFGLPGNPVSAMVTFELLVRPTLSKLAGKTHTPTIIHATLADAMTTDGRRTYNRVTIQRDGDNYTAHSTGNQNSGALMSMVLADGLVIIPENTPFVPIGTKLPVLLLRQID